MSSAPNNLLSGDYGTVKVGVAGSGASTIVVCDHWTFEGKAAVHKRGHNQSGGFKEAIAGTREGSGTIKGPVSPSSGLPPLDDGDQVALMLYSTPTHGKTIPYAIVSSVKLEVDMDNGDITGWEANYEVNGQWGSF